MRVLMVSRGVLPIGRDAGGAERVAFELAVALADNDDHVVLVSDIDVTQLMPVPSTLTTVSIDRRRATDRLIKAAPTAFVRWSCSTSWGSPRGATRRGRLPRRWGLRRGARARALAALLLARRLRARGSALPLLYTEHDASPWSCRYRTAFERAVRRVVYRFVNLRACAAATSVITNFEELADELATRTGLARGRFEVIPNGCADGEGSTPSRADGAARYCLFVGSLVARKAPDMLLRALTRTELNCVFVGDGPMRGDLSAWRCGPGCRGGSRLREPSIRRWSVATTTVPTSSCCRRCQRACRSSRWRRWGRGCPSWPAASRVSPRWSVTAATGCWWIRATSSDSPTPSARSKRTDPCSTSCDAVRRRTLLRSRGGLRCPARCATSTSETASTASGAPSCRSRRTEGCATGDPARHGRALGSRGHRCLSAPHGAGVPRRRFPSRLLARGRRPPDVRARSGRHAPVAEADPRLQRRDPGDGLHGRYPDETGYWMEYCYRPATSPWKGMGRPSGLDRSRSTRAGAGPRHSSRLLRPARSPREGAAHMSVRNVPFGAIDRSTSRSERHDLAEGARLPQHLRCLCRVGPSVGIPGLLQGPTGRRAGRRGRAVPSDVGLVFVYLHQVDMAGAPLRDSSRLFWRRVRLDGRPRRPDPRRDSAALRGVETVAFSDHGMSGCSDSSTSTSSSSTPAFRRASSSPSTRRW